MQAQPLTDSELTRAAQAGDSAALGTLLVRHEPGMRAVALSLLGRGPDAEDAVQQAMLVALSRIRDVREPASTGAWLRTIVRNTCRTVLSATARTRTTAELDVVTEASPEEIYERHALHDSVRRAIDGLSPSLRMTILLRHFSEVSTYEQIANVCGVPVGTVRSRLSQARAKLVEDLRTQAHASDGDAATPALTSRREGLETVDALNRGELGRLMSERWDPDAMYFDGAEPVGGTDFLVRGAAADLDAGVRQRFAHAVAGRDIAIWEVDLISPVDSPGHCPPGVTWVMSLKNGRTSQLRLFHAPRQSSPPQ